MFERQFCMKGWTIVEIVEELCCLTSDPTSILHDLARSSRTPRAQSVKRLRKSAWKFRWNSCRVQDDPRWSKMIQVAQSYRDQGCHATIHAYPDMEMCENPRDPTDFGDFPRSCINPLPSSVTRRKQRTVSTWRHGFHCFDGKTCRSTRGHTQTPLLRQTLRAKQGSANAEEDWAKRTKMNQVVKKRKDESGWVWLSQDSKFFIFNAARFLRSKSPRVCVSEILIHAEEAPLQYWSIFRRCLALPIRTE